MEANWVSREWKVLEKIQGYYIQKVAHKDKKYVIQWNNQGECYASKPVQAPLYRFHPDKIRIELG